MRASRAWALLLLAAVGCAEADASMTGKVGSKHKAPKYIAMVGAADSSPVAAFSASFGEPTQVPGDCTGDAVLHLDFDEASGNLTEDCQAATFSAFSGPTYGQTAPSGLGDAVYGDDGPYFSSADNAAWDVGTDDFVLEWWMRGDYNSGTTYVFSKAETASPYKGFHTYLDNTSLILRLSDTTVNAFSASGCGSYWDHSWHKVRIEVDRDAQVTFYLDGQNCGNAATNADSQGDVSNAESFFVFQGQPNPSAMFEGALADFTLAKGSTAYDSGFVTGIEPETGPSATFVRATGAMKIDPTVGAAQEIISGIPVISAPMTGANTALRMPASGDATGVWLGYAVTPSAPHSYALDDASWTKTNVAVTADQGLDAHGAMRADEVDDADGVNAGTVDKNITVLANQDHWAIACYSHPTSTPTPVLEIDGTQCTCGTADTAIQCCTCQDTNSSGTSINLKFYPTGLTGSATGKVNVFALDARQVYHNAPVQMLAPQGASTSVINTPSLTYGTAAGLFDHSSGGTISFWYYVYQASTIASNYAFYLLNGAGPDVGIYRNPGSADWRAISSGLSDNFVINGADTPDALANGWHHLCFRWDQATSALQFVHDGVASTEKTSDTFSSEDTSGGTSILGGSATNASNFDGYLSNVKGYGTTDIGEQGCIDLYNAESASYAGHWVDPGVRYASIERLKAGPQPKFNAKFDRAGVGAAGVLQ